MKTLTILIALLLFAAGMVLAQPAQKDAPAQNDWSAFHTAVTAGDLSAVEALIAAGRNVEVKAPGPWQRSLLHVAAATGGKHPEAAAAITKKLIEAGADANATMLSGLSPLHEAARSGSEEVAKVLVANGARLNRQICIKNCLDPDYKFNDATALDAAIGSKKPKLVALLRKSGAKTEVELNKAAR